MQYIKQNDNILLVEYNLYDAQKINLGTNLDARRWLNWSRTRLLNL